MSYYSGVGAMARTLPTKLQWIVAVVLPLLFKFHTWIWIKMVKKAKPCNLKLVMLDVDINLKAFHTLYIAVCLAKVNNM